MDKRLNELVNGSRSGIDSCVNRFRLYQLINRYELSHAQELDWERVRHLYIIGSEEAWAVESSGGRKPQLKQSCYVDWTGIWVLLAGLSTEDIQQYVNRCSDELELLFIGHTKIRVLTIPPLRKLRTLHLVGNLHLSDVYGFDQLPMPETLKECTISYSPLKNIDFLGNCSALETLDCSGTSIRLLPDKIRSMKRLSRLTLWELSLEDLPDWLPELGLPISRYWGNGISLRNTTVEGVDMGVFSQSQKIIRAWFEARKQARIGEPLNEIKVVFLGDGSTGKSLTVARLLEDGAHPAQFDGEATPGIAIEDRSYTLSDGRKVRVHFWDFGGQEILHCMHRIFLTDRTLYVVMINARNNTQDDQARYWLHNVRSFASGCPVLLVLNQIDQNPNASINERSMKKLHPNLRQIIRLSALNFDQETFNREFTRKMLDEIAGFESLGTFFPPAWKQIMDRVRGMEGNYIRGNEFKEICRNNGVDDEKLRLDLLKWFHDLGVCFCYSRSQQLQDYVVLKPEWITNAIYTIIWNKRADTANGMVDQDDIYRLLSTKAANGVRRVRSDMTYMPDDVGFVLNIARQFRLSFPVINGREFIPLLCNANALPESDTFPEEPGVIEFRLEYDYLPNNVIHRLMVDMRRDLLPDKVWLTGALLWSKYNDIEALVKSEGDVLSIYIKSADVAHNAHTYLNTLRGALDEIHKDMGLKEPETLVAYKEDGQTEYFSYELLEGSRKNHVEVIYSRKFRRMIPIADILNGTDSRVAAEKEKLVKDIAEVCVRMRNVHILNKAFENDRNDWLRDNLRSMGYWVSDQTRVGRGETGRQAGSLDFQLLREDNVPWTNIEAMNLNGATKTQLRYWENHLDRLMDNYNPAGLPTLFLVSYVNCSADTYHRLFSAYTEHMRTYEPPGTLLRHGTLTEVLPLREQHGFVRANRCTYDRCGTPVTVYHYFVGFAEDTSIVEEPVAVLR